MSAAEPDLPGAGPPRSWSARPVPWGGVLAWLRASVGTRRLVPTGTALLGIDVVYRLVRRMSRRRMAETSALVETIVAGTPAEVELSQLPEMRSRHQPSARTHSGFRRTGLAENGVSG